MVQYGTVLSAGKSASGMPPLPAPRTLAGHKLIMDAVDVAVIPL
jgi:hypothetical protein